MHVMIVFAHISIGEVGACTLIHVAAKEEAFTCLDTQKILCVPRRYPLPL